MMSAPEKPPVTIEEQTAVIMPEPVALPPETAVSPPTPSIPVTPFHCPQCQSVVVPGKKFCTTCGFRLTPAEELVPPPPSNLSIPEASPSTYPTVIETPGVAPIVSPSVVVPPPIVMEAPIQAVSMPGKCIICGVDLMPEAVFCTNCGQPIGPTHAPPLAPPDSLPSVSSFTGSVLITQPDWSISMPVGPVAKYCENCGKGLTADVTICPECSSSRFDPA